ncbi:precorrin-6y C5,15-methyltransferase (decarboxylating) subunit CbiE [Rubrobacter tropicus]|uniref:Precorrin-6y C5,15-methyltransferase (Decarboxylating) subunit CbiE n=1 Tax=Rubrobacter tropicus TaxID=2653851 RepID=A0A6G8QEY6_9ACTN|nr:precorrin-6y C5,15-methyltransferase (decarboxylating) subunit CbiE [Rubrobacter tropicus]
MAVIGLDGSPRSPEAIELLEGAALVAGGKRHLEDLAIEPERAVSFEGDLSGALSRIETESGPVVVLASGDPGFFGIVRLLAEKFGSGALRVMPASSSVALAFARAGISWDDAVTVSAHGREPRRAVNVCRAHPKVAVLTSPDFGPAELAKELGGLGRTFVVAERLGRTEESVFRGDAAEVAGMKWEDPNVVLVLDEGRTARKKGWISSGIGSPERWALPEDQFEHRSGMITKGPTRAFVLSRLGPGPGDLVWDVGSGSGSVAIECARLGAAAIAVERDPESCARLRRNAERHGVDVPVVEGEAPDALRDLPEPDAVFIGGTGGAFEEIVKLCAARARRSVVLALVGLERVVPAGRILEGCGLTVESTFLQASPVEGVGAMRRVVPGSAVFVVCGSRT